MTASHGHGSAPTAQAAPPGPAAAVVSLAPPFDPERLRALRGERADEREVLLEMLMHVPHLMQCVARAVVLRDAERLAVHARELRRCCTALDARALAEPCAVLESMGERGDFSGARAALDRAQREHTRLTLALAAHLSHLRGA
jgi:hypothetical protein